MKRELVAKVMAGMLLLGSGCVTLPGDTTGASGGSGVDDDDGDGGPDDEGGSEDGADDGNDSTPAGEGGNGDGGTDTGVGGDTSLGNGEGGVDDSGGISDTGGDPPEIAELCTGVAGPPTVRRLTSKQLHRTLQRIFDDPGVPEAQVVDDPIVRGFKVDAADAVVRDIGAQQIMQYAERVAEWAIPQKLGAIAPCQTLDPTCRDQVIRTLGERFHREPLSDAMVTTYASLMDGESDFESAVHQLVAAFIQSPYFLYRREVGADGAAALTDYEIASNLSYSLTAAPPDDELRALAASGQLRDEAVLAAQAQRLMQTPDGQEVLADFVHGWLEVDDLHSRVKVENNGVPFDAELRSLMLNETAMVFRAVFNAGGTVADLFTSDFTVVNQRLGHFYRMWQANAQEPEVFPIPAQGEGYRGTGLLAHGSVLARHASADNSSPVQRGVMVQRRILCNDLPDPPSDVDTNLTAIPPGSTNRQRYQQHSSDPNCSGCHTLIDPVGFVFENYDEFGRWRDQESNQPVDATGQLTGLQSGTVPLDGLDSLSRALADSPQVRSCFARYVAYYLYGSGVCDVDPQQQVPAAASLQGIFQGVVTAPYFRERTPAQ